MLFFACVALLGAFLAKGTNEPFGQVYKFLFDYDKDFSKAKVKHTFIIEELVVPKEYANDPALARVKAKRKGKIKRFVEVDGNSYEQEIKFEA